MRPSPSVLLLAGALIALLAGCGPSPEEIQAKEEVAALDGKIAALQARIDGLPALDVGDEARAALEMQVHSFGLLAAIKVPGDIGQLDEAAFLAHIIKGASAAKRRGIDTRNYRTGDPEDLLYASVDDVPAYREDLGDLLNRADTFDSGMALAKGSVEEIPDLTVPRGDDTERYFRQHAEKKAAYEAMTASLDSKSSAAFRSDVGRLKQANEVFYDIMYWYTHIGEAQVGFTVPDDLVALFPDLVDEADALAYCWRLESQGDATCANLGWETRLRPLMAALHDAYSGLEKEV